MTHPSDIFAKYGLDVEELSSTVYIVKNYTDTIVDISLLENEFEHCVIHVLDDYMDDNHQMGKPVLILLGSLDGKKQNEIINRLHLPRGTVIVSGYDKECVRLYNEDSFDTIDYAQ